MPILPIDWLKRSEKAVKPYKHGQNAHKQHIHHFGTMQFRGGNAQSNLGTMQFWGENAQSHLGTMQFWGENAQSHLGTMQFWSFGRRAQVVT